MEVAFTVLTNGTTCRTSGSVSLLESEIVFLSSVRDERDR